MGDFKQAYQIETIKAQCGALTSKGCAVDFQLHEWQSLTPVSVTVYHDKKMYHFSDPDPDVIIRQLCTLTAGINKEENIFKKFINLMEAKHGKVQSSE